MRPSPHPAQGLSHSDAHSDNVMYPATSSQFSHMNNASRLIQRPGGLMEQGVSKGLPHNPYAGQGGRREGGKQEEGAKGSHGAGCVKGATEQPVCRSVGEGEGGRGGGVVGVRNAILIQESNLSLFIPCFIPTLFRK